MRKYFFIILMLVILFVPVVVNAKRGCCSHHGGVAGCSSGGRQICGDGSLSPTCTCTPPVVYGCMDYKAYNYNSSANKDDGSCKYYVNGCMDKEALNYNAEANKDDGSCKYKTDIKDSEVIEDKKQESSYVEKNSNSKNNDIIVDNKNKDNDNNNDNSYIFGMIFVSAVAGGVALYKIKFKK